MLDGPGIASDAALSVRTSDFDYYLPPDRIAQHPMPHRDGSRLLVVHRTAKTIEHRQFRELPNYLKAGDVLVINNSRVLPARLHGRRQPSGGKFEILLLEPESDWVWWTLLKPGKRVHPGSSLEFVDHLGHPTPLKATVLEKNPEGHCKLTFEGVPNFLTALDQWGHVPLPPYIRRDSSRIESEQASQDSRDESDKERYQTVYAQAYGSVAAPTAGLHFTGRMLDDLRAQDVQVVDLTLHVGAGTFQPVQVEDPGAHVMHSERYILPESTARAIVQAKTEGRRVLAVGTTSLRVLESVARLPSAKPDALPHGAGTTRLFLYPPTRFQVVDALLTNFHLPQSTLLMLVSAFASPGSTEGRDFLLQIYREAVEREYRFFSYGDAMLLL